MKRALIYSLKVWATVAILGPGVHCLFLLLTKSPDVKIIGFYYYILAVWLGSIFCLPGAVLLAALLIGLGKFAYSSALKKIMLSVVLLFFLLGTYFIICRMISFQFSTADYIEGASPYFLVGLASIWLYKLRQIPGGKLSGAPKSNIL